MEKKQVLEILKKLKESNKRNFKQSFDLIVNLKGLDLKKPTDQVDFFTHLPHGRGKEVKIAAIVGPELKAQADKVCDETVMVDDLPKYSDKKLARKLSKKYEFFIAQANIMAKLAASLGRVLGPKGKMPNPKAGAVVPPGTNLEPLYKRLKDTLRVTVKTNLSYKCSVGKEDMKDEDVAENIMHVYDQLIHHLPGEENNVKAAFVKLTMSKPVKLR